MKVKIHETHLAGIPISQGIAIGKPFFFTIAEDEIIEIDISDDAIEFEVVRYQQAVKRCQQDVKRLQEQLEIENALEAVAILDTHVHIMNDPLITDNVVGQIRKRKKNADFVFKQLAQEYQTKFKSMPDTFFKERAMDLQDITRRIVSYLCEERHICLVDIPENTIVFARELAASDVAEVKAGSVCAFVTESGGTTSHAAIVAKAKGIPYIGNVDFSLFDQIDVEMAIVDGHRGDIYLNPDQTTLEKYRKTQEQEEEYFKELEKTSSLKCQTRDGHSMNLSANIEMVNEISMVHRYGGHGVGLFRSEYILLAQQNFPSELEQLAIYQSLVIKMDGKPIVIRTFDVGGDKLTIHQQSVHRGNPYLGCRAIRFLLQEREIFKTQLRAILQASAFGNVRILFPMVSGLSELQEAKALVEECKCELLEAGKDVAKVVPIGCMIEVPSAAIIADHLAAECDFLSIGTNDLVQYALAADRSNQSMSVQYAPTHPAVIRLIQLVVQQANTHSIPVTVCGEVAADPKFTALLMGLGVIELSVTARCIPIIKQAIRSTTIILAKQLSQEILSMNSQEEIEEKLESAYQASIRDSLDKS